MWCTHFPPGSQAAKAATAVAPRKEPRSEPVVKFLPVGRIDLKKAEEERKAAEEPDKNNGIGEDSKIQTIPSPLWIQGGLAYIYQHEWLIYTVNVCKYTIHGWYGNCFCWEDTVTDEHH